MRMTSGTVFEQGEILIVPFPFTNLSGMKQRPVLVLSTTDYNKQTEDLITCGITSYLKGAEHSVLINNENLVEGSIPTQSRIKVDKLFTLERSVVKKSIGKIDDVMFGKVKEIFVDLF